MIPVHERLIVRPFQPETKTPGGIIIPDTAQQRPSKALVIAVGEGVKDRPMIFKKDDVVFHVLGAGIPMEHCGELLYFLRDVDCLAYIRDETEPQNP